MSIVSFKVGVSLLTFCLVDLSINVSGVLKSPTIMVLLLISHFILVSICLTYCGAPMLGAYILIIVISSSWIDHLIIMSCPSLSLFTDLISKSILSDMSIATPAFFLVSICVKYLFPALHFQSVCVPGFEVSFL